MKPSILPCVAALLCGGALTVSGQSASEPQTLHIEQDPTTGGVDLRFWSHEGRIYFFEHSLDLYSWNALPDYVIGNNELVTYGVTFIPPTSFFRLGSVQASWADFLLEDFDGDGLTNGYELQNGLNPFSRDTDRDGLPDGYEIAFALDPFANDALGDADGDGVLNFEDARPDDDTIGRLAISISLPANGSVIQ